MFDRDDAAGTDDRFERHWFHGAAFGDEVARCIHVHAVVAVQRHFCQVARITLAPLAGDAVAQFDRQRDASFRIIGPVHHAVAHRDGDINPRPAYDQPYKP